jgi:serine/threonine protein phosphatase PrpC
MDMSASKTTLSCCGCGATLEPDDRYCEQCGTRRAALSEQERAEDRCSACGAPLQEIDGDRYCSRCGVRGRSPKDRREVDLVVAGGVCDRGCTRRRNEDALHMHTGLRGVVAAVVCDGISSALSAGLAAQRAADTAGDVLAHAVQNSGTALEQATIDAAAHAQETVNQVPWSARSDRDAPSCTLVSAVCRDGELVIGWIGDSRAYWISKDGSRLLTADHSWAQEQVDAGALSAPQAAADPRAHTITRWLGRDAPSEMPQLDTIRPEQPGRLVLCTDGLWNYAPEAAHIAAVLDALPPGAAPIAAARALADFAITAGGHDNVTVAVIDINNEQERRG